MEEISKALKNIQENLAEQKQEMREMENNITININKNIDEKFKNIDLQNRKIENTIREQEVRIDQIEREVRRRNIIFFGIEEKEHNYHQLESIILEIINKKIKIPCTNLEIESLKRLGKKGNKIRPIILTLTTLGKKIQILKNKMHLQDTSFYIKEDFPKKVLEIRKQLQEQLQQEREQGKNAVIRYDKIILLKNKQNKEEWETNISRRKSKRNLPESPEYTGNEQNGKGENIKQIPKKNKSNITSYMRKEPVEKVFQPAKTVQQTQFIEE